MQEKMDRRGTGLRILLGQERLRRRPVFWVP